MTTHNDEENIVDKINPSSRLQHPESHIRERGEPEELSNPLPKWYSLMAVGFVLWGVSYFYVQGNVPADAGDRRSAIPRPGTVSLSGDLVYSANCASCHQASGAGIPGAFPPLDGSLWVTGNPDIAAQILLHGLQGPIIVKGTSYSGVMPAMGHLSDAELSGVLTYIRTQWSNNVSEALTADWMNEQRQRFPERGPWQGGAEIRKNVGNP